METAVRFAQEWEALGRWGLWSRDGDWARLGTRQMQPKSSGFMAEHMAPARDAGLQGLGKSSESVTMLTKARGMQMSPLKSQMAFGLFYSALFDKTPPKSTKKLTLCTGDHSLPAFFLLLPFPSSSLLPFLSPQIRRAHKQKL